MNVAMILKPKDEVAYVFENDTVRQGLEKMKNHGYTAIPVINNEGSYVGTISEGDFLWHVLESVSSDLKTQEQYFVSDLIRPDWNPSVAIDANIRELLLRTMEQNFVPVTDSRGSFIGIVTRKDVIAYFYERTNNMEM